MSIFEGVKNQIIDDHGKARALVYDYEGGLTLFISVLPPLDVEEVGMEDIYLTSIKNVQEFAKKKNLEIVEQDGSERRNITQGVWVKPKTEQGIIFGYIPIDFEIDEEGQGISLKGVPFSSEQTTDPFMTGESSMLSIYRKNKKIAEYLKEYSIIEWAHSQSDDDDEENFGSNNYVIIPNYEYDVDKLDTSIERFNDVLYDDGRLIVKDEETMDRLIMFVKVSTLNNMNIKEEYLNRKTINGGKIYENSSDFKQNSHQVIFSSISNIRRWRDAKLFELHRNNIFSEVLPSSKSPYYFKNFKINNGRIAIIQNTEGGDLFSALYVSKKWRDNRVNKGYNVGYINITDEPKEGDEKDVRKETKPLRDKVEYDVYTESEGKTFEGKGSDKLSLIGYDDGSYGAILFL